MNIKLRLEKLEQKQNPDIMEVVIIRFTDNGQLPAPHMSGNVKVSYQYASDTD
jgi:hypothetical protein